MMLMRGQADPKSKACLDKIGLGLLIVWVGALQIMLDEGRNKDWFNSPGHPHPWHRRRDRLRRLPDLGADREEPDRRS